MKMTPLKIYYKLALSYLVNNVDPLFLCPKFKSLIIMRFLNLKFNNSLHFYRSDQHIFNYFYLNKTSVKCLKAIEANANSYY